MATAVECSLEKNIQHQNQVKMVCIEDFLLRVTLTVQMFAVTHGTFYIRLALQYSLFYT